MNKNFHLLFFLRTLAISTAAIHTATWAYDPATHQDLTRYAINASVIGKDPSFYTKLGLSPGQTFPLFGSGSPPVPFTNAGQPLPEGAAYGARFEDGVFLAVSTYHFFDPQHGGRALTIPAIGTPGAPSPDWMLEPAGKSFPNQYYSFPKAQAQLLLAFTSASPNDRWLAFGRVFQSLGHLTHHIQDMAQPQHVRNEAHLDTGYKMDASAFEAVAKNELTNEKIGQLISLRPYAIPSFPTVREYWTSPLGAYTGMADFTSKNFVTYGTGYKYNTTTGTITPDGTDSSFASYALPDGYNISDGSLKTRRIDTVTVRTWVGQDVSFKFGYIVGEIFDTYNQPNYILKNQILAERTQIQDFSKNGFESYRWTGLEAWRSGWSVLIPRAVAFSAGLINHFFRGQVNLTDAGNGSWALQNASPVQASGVYKILAESTAGIRTQIAEVPLTLAPGASSQIPLAPPNNTSKLVVAFVGALGGEPNTVHGRVVEVPKVSTTTQLAVGPNSFVQGNPVALTATVVGTNPSGTVQFKRNGINLGAPVSITSGSASYSDPAPTLGSYTYAAEYSGDFRNLGSSTTQVITISPPPVPCGTPLVANGSSQGLTRVLDMGSVPGAVQIKFDAYHIPDGLVVKGTQSGKVYVNSGGLISGEHTYSFNFDSTQNGGARTIEVKVTGNQDPNTAWSLKSSCPGQGVADFPRYKMTYGVNYYNKTPCGKWDFWLDDPNFRGSGLGSINFTSSKSIYLTGGGVHLLRAVFVGSCPSGLGYDIGTPYFNTGKGNVYFASGYVAVVYQNQTSPGGQAN